MDVDALTTEGESVTVELERCRGSVLIWYCDLVHAAIDAAELRFWLDCEGPVWRRWNDVEFSRDGAGFVLMSIRPEIVDHMIRPSIVRLVTD